MRVAQHETPEEKVVVVRPTAGRKTIGLKSPRITVFCAAAPEPAASPAPVAAGHGKTKRPASAPPPVAARPPTKRSKNAEADVAMVAPLPIVDYIQSRVKPKACGFCELCLKPPCGKCKQCVLNAKSKTDKRRCVELQCVRFAKADDRQPAPSSSDKGDIPATSEGIAAALMANDLEIAAMLPKLSKAHSDQSLRAKYMKLLDRKSELHSAQVSIRNTKSHRKSPFPVGFPETWGIISKLEKARLKFALFVVKQTPDTKTDIVDRKRLKRDILDRTISEYCQLWSEELAPLDIRDAEEYWKLVGKPRDSSSFTPNSSSSSSSHPGEDLDAIDPSSDEEDDGKSTYSEDA